MTNDCEGALAELVGRRLLAADRVVDVLILRFGGDGDGDERALHVACPWRLADAERVLVGAGDLLTPADPDGEPESFDWEPPGASWLDVRLDELAARRGAAPPTVTAVSADPFGGLRLGLSDGLVLELFPNSTPTGHVSTEFWRLSAPGAADIVVGTFGVERESGA